MTSSPHPCARCSNPAWGTLCKTCYDEMKPPVIHGTQLMYRRGCKCQTCVSAATHRRAERKKRQRERELGEVLKRETTIKIRWGDVTQEHALDISRRVAREITKFKGVEDAHVKDPVRVANGRKGGLLGGGKGHHRLKAVERPVSQSFADAKAVHTNGELDLSKVPSFKARGKGKSLVEVVAGLRQAQ